MRFRLTFLLLLAHTCAFAFDLGTPVNDTPYDSFLVPVVRTLEQSSSEKPSLKQAMELLSRAHAFRYSFSEPYAPQDPAVTEQRQAGDCKDKALWLCRAMNDRSVRFVVGKAIRGSAKNHAWLVWQQENQWWILDPTMSSTPFVAEAVSPNRYLPLFSYAADARYVHGALSSGSPAISANAGR